MSKKIEAPVTIMGNTFCGVKWDKEATEAVIVVSKALLNLTELFKSQNINIETMLRIEAETPTMSTVTSAKGKLITPTD